MVPASSNGQHDTKCRCRPDIQGNLVNRREIKLRFDSFEVALRGPESIVGRSGYSSVVLSDPSVSRVHASIVLEGDHGHVRDLGSKNGTFVNGRRLGGDPAPGRGRGGGGVRRARALDHSAFPAGQFDR